MQSTLKIVSIFICLILAFSPLAFASDLSFPDQSPDPEQEPLEVDSNSLTLQTKTMELRAVEKTITDVYNLLDDSLFGNSTFAGGMLAQIADQMTYWVSGTQYTIADLQGMTWSIANSINNQLTSTNSILGNIYNENYTTNRKLEYVFSAIEDTINIKWYSFLSSYLGTKRSPDDAYLTSRSWGSDFYVYFDLQANYSNYPNITRFFVPLYATLNSYSGRPPLDLEFIYSNGSIARLSDFDYFLENTQSGSYIYLIDFGQRASGTFAIHVQSSADLVFREDFAGHVFYIPFDTLDYQIIKTAFYQAKSATSLDELKTISSTLSSLASNVSSGSQAAEALADYFVSPQKQAAEDASSQVINSTLNNFTGSGSGAAKSSDSNAMKDVSGSIQSGLNGGGSVSGATGVFNSGSDFWGWFTQQNSNYINNPYPAPTVYSTRGSGDEIVDFLTPNSNELQDLLRQGGDQR